MGLLLSVLVSCVGVIELITFYHNIQRNLRNPPIQQDLSTVREDYINALYKVRERIIQDIENLKQNEASGSKSNQNEGLTLRRNSHEDIEFSKNISHRSKSESPRSFLVTEKDARSRSPSPVRCFEVSDEFQGHAIKKSKANDSLPEFFVEEQKNVVKESKRVPLPLPRQFIVTDEKDLILEQLFCAHPPSSRFSDTDLHYRRSASPYPSFDLTVPRNSICNELTCDPTVSVAEVDEEGSRSKSPSPCPKVDTILSSSAFDSTEYWTNKVLVVPPNKKIKSRSASPGVHKNQILDQQKEGKSKLELESDSNCNFSKIKDVGSSVECAENSNSSIVKDEEELSTYNEQFLDNLDGVTKRKERSSRQTIRRKKSGDLDTARNLKRNSSKEENSDAILVKAAEELQKFSSGNGENSSDVPGGNKSEPFWVNH